MDTNFETFILTESKTTTCLATVLHDRATQNVHGTHEGDITNSLYNGYALIYKYM